MTNDTFPVQRLSTLLHGRLDRVPSIEGGQSQTPSKPTGRRTDGPHRRHRSIPGTA